MLTALLPQSVQALLHVPFRDISDEQMSSVLSDFGMGSLHPELKSALLALLQDKGLDSAADLIRSPAAIMEVRQFISRCRVQQAVCDFCGSPLEVTDAGSFCSCCGISH